jgi:serine/threonine protein kinase/tetratricopeptide (TPR) repeat protein
VEQKRIPQAQQLINSRYRVLRSLGEGAMGAVLLVVDTLEDGDIVALKQIRPDVFSPESREAFRNEFRAMTQLRHPNVVEVYDFGAIGGSTDHFFTMEFVEGNNLLQACEGQGEQTLYDFALQITRALEYIHTQGFIHFDLKPDNIMVRHDGLVKVMDFGLVGKASHLPHAFKGTVHYISPEMTRGERVDARADLYSLGALLFHVFAGRTLFEGDTVSEILRQHRHVVPDLAARSQRKIPDRFAKVLARLLAKEPENRYSSASELLYELEELSMASSVVPDPSSAFVHGSRFLGREEEIQFLKDIFRSRITEANPGDPLLLLVSGATGIGKSRLLAEFRHYVQLHGAKFYQGFCLFSREHSFLPVREIVRAIVREILPASDEAPSEVPDSVPHAPAFDSISAEANTPRMIPAPEQAPRRPSSMPVSPENGVQAIADTFRDAASPSPGELHEADVASTTLVVPSQPIYRPPQDWEQKVDETLSSELGEPAESALEDVSTWPLVDVVKTHAASLKKLLENEHALSAMVTTEPSFAHPEQEKEWLLGSICRFLLAVAAELPMVLYCVDLHWADDLTVELLTRLARRVDLAPGSPSPRLLVCGCYRDEELPGRPLEAKLAELTASRLVFRLELLPFDRHQVGSMVRSMFGSVALSDDELELLRERTLGRPLFIEETVRSLIRYGAIRRDGSGVSISVLPLREGGELADLDVMFRESFRALDPAEFEVLSLLSVFNRPAGLQLLREATPELADKLAPLVGAVRRKGFVQRAWSDGEHQYSIRHHHVREQIYASLPSPVLDRMHGRALFAIESVYGEAETYLEDLAHHALRSNRFDKGIRFTSLAADLARRLYDWPRATTRYLRAHALLPELPAAPSRDKLEIELAIAIASSSYYSAWQENVDRLKRALSLAVALGDVDAQAGVYNAMGRTYYGLGRQREAIPCFREFIRLTENRADDKARALPYSVLGRVYFFLGQFREAAQYLERATDLFAQQKGAEEEVSYASGMHGSALCYLGDTERGLSLVDQSIELAQKIHHKTRLALGHTYRGICLANHGDWKQARRWLELGLEHSKRTGDGVAIGTGSSFLGLTYLMEGNVEKAVDLCRAGLREIADRGSTWTFTMICAHIIESLLASGQLERAEEHEALGNKALETGERWGQAPLAVAFAHLRAARGREEGALEWFDKAISVAGEQGALPFLAKGLLARGLYLAERGHLVRSRQDLEMASDLFSRLGMTFYLQSATEALAGKPVTACL